MDTERAMRTLVSRVWVLHALYFVIGGLWAVLGQRSFQAISGTKTDYWLVRTVGGLLAVVGVGLVVAGWSRRLTPELAWIGIGTSGVLTIIDIVYASKHRISRVYLLDAAANVGLISGWIAFLRRGPDGEPTAPRERADHISPGAMA